MLRKILCYCIPFCISLLSYTLGRYDTEFIEIVSTLIKIILSILSLAVMFYTMKWWAKEENPFRRLCAAGHRITFLCFLI